MEILHGAMEILHGAMEIRGFPISAYELSTTLTEQGPFQQFWHNASAPLGNSRTNRKLRIAWQSFRNQRPIEFIREVADNRPFNID